MTICVCLYMQVSPPYASKCTRYFFFSIHIRWIRGLFLSVARVNGDFAQNTTIHLYSVCMWISAFHLYMQYIIMQGYFFQNSISGHWEDGEASFQRGHKKILAEYIHYPPPSVSGVSFFENILSDQFSEGVAIAWNFCIQPHVSVYIDVFPPSLYVYWGLIWFFVDVISDQFNDTKNTAPRECVFLLQLFDLFFRSLSNRYWKIRVICENFSL